MNAPKPRLCGAPLPRETKIPNEELHIFFSTGKLPVEGKRALVKELRDREYFQAESKHSLAQMAERGLCFHEVREVLSQGTCIQASFERSNGMLRYIGFRVRNEKNPLVHDVLIYQVEELDSGIIEFIWVTGWKCPIHRCEASYKHRPELESELSWDDVQALRES